MILKLIDWGCQLLLTLIWAVLFIITISGIFAIGIITLVLFGIL